MLAQCEDRLQQKGIKPIPKLVCHHQSRRMQDTQRGLSSLHPSLYTAHKWPCPDNLDTFILLYKHGFVKVSGSMYLEILYKV